jgi:flagellar hook protein FlgE
LTSNLNDLDANTVDYVNGDTITVGGLDADGTVVNATFVYGTNGTTVGDLINFLNSQFTGGTAALLPDGNIQLTANAVGESTLSLQLSNDPKTSWGSHGFVTTTAGAEPDTVTSSIEVFDNAGIGHNVTLTYERQVDGSWTLTADMAASEGQVISGTISGLQFASNGSFSGVFGPSNQLQFKFTGQPGNQTVAITLGTPGGFDGITQFGDSKSVQAKSQDGYPAGELSSMSFNSDGNLIGFFSNGIQKTLAEIGIATMANQDGLSRAGDTMYVETPNSGSTILSKAQTGKAGVIRSGALESSNVDIAREFVNLIEAQRGFQANARVISATDALLAELVNIIR